MATPSAAQIIIVGSGMNSLVCAALLAQRGKSVLVLERNDRLGGCIRTEELFPGYRHDVLSCWYPLFVGSPAYAALKPALHAAGLEFMQGDYTTGLVLPDGFGLALKQDIDDTARRLDAWAPGDGTAFAQMAQRLFGEDAALTFGLLGQNPYGAGMVRLLFKEWRKRGMDGLAAFAADSIAPFRRWAERALQSDAARALIAPWVLHTGLGPDDAASALIGKLTFAAVVAGGICVSAWHGVGYTELATLAGAQRAGTALGLGNTGAFAALGLTSLCLPQVLAWSSWPVVWLVAAGSALIAWRVLPAVRQ